MYNNSWYDKLQRKFGKFAISNLMKIIVFGMGLVFLIDLLLAPYQAVSIRSLLAFNRDAIFSGQIWRIITFIFIPPNSSLFFIIFSLYLYYMIGNALESQWGVARFNLFYLVGVIGSVIAGLITGYAINDYLNMSLFIAFALMFPDYELLLFMILPIKIKYLAMLDGLGMLISFMGDSFSGKIAMLVSIANLILFFGGSFIDSIKNYKRKRDFQKMTGMRK